jgi:hypothetical protein
MRANKITKHFTNLAVMAGLAVLGSPAVYAGPGQGTLYGTDGASMNLVTVDPVTGLNLTSALTSVNFQALAVNPADGVIFAGSAAGDVYTVTPDGAATMLGAAGAGVEALAITGMDFDDNGVLFAVLDMVDDPLLLGSDGDTLATIDTLTGVATIVGPLGLDGFQAIAFAPDGTLYGMRLNDVFNYDSYLHVIDLLNGSAGLETPITDSLSQPVDGGITGLQFGCDGTLYAGTDYDAYFSFSGGNVGIVGPLNAPVYTPTGGPSVASLNGGVEALAFACDPPPPTTLEVVVNLDLNPGMPIRCGQSDRDLVTAVLSSDGSLTPAFDATTINADTVRFGRDGSATLASEKHQQDGTAIRHEADANGDGLTDLVFHFRLGDTDFSCADIPIGSSAFIPATISGQLAGGEEFEGTGGFEMRK